MIKTDFSKVRGFNYLPSYGCNSFEHWMYFKEAVFEKELKTGKKYFPRMNTVRLWSDLAAYQVNPKKLMDGIETALKICESLDLKVVVCLFNGWHDHTCDIGGIYFNHFLPNMGQLSEHHSEHADNYIIDLVSEHKNDDRIIGWDVCNEPFSSYGSNKELSDMLRPFEAAWLRARYMKCKDAGAEQPVSFSPVSADIKWLEEFDDIMDVYMVHPYFFFNEKEFKKISTEECSDILKKLKQFAVRKGKQIFATETCWGAVDDSLRAEMIKKTLDAFKENDVGFIVHALWYSRVADLHNEETAPVGAPGNLCFIKKDGSLRPCHEIFNYYC